MPLLKPMDERRFSDHGPMPQALSVGTGFAVMLLCLQAGQELVAPASDASETLFHVLEGEGFVREGTTRHPVQANEAVHVLPGSAKALVAGEGRLVVLGVRQMGGGKRQESSRDAS